jgi:VanZ family protein
VTRDRLARWLPPLALMALIFAFSAQPSLSSGLSFDLVLRKAAHMAEYGLLWWLLWRALGFRHPAAAVAVALVYAASDELHQHFVPGRHASPWDWAIDAAGIGLAGLVTVLAARRRRRQRR